MCGRQAELQPPPTFKKADLKSRQSKAGKQVSKQAAGAPSVRKRLHYRRWRAADACLQPTSATRPLHLHVSLIRLRVYSLEDQLPAETAGCGIKGPTLGVRQNLTLKKHQKHNRP